jgi:preprotein translocase subunit SecA
VGGAEALRQTAVAERAAGGLVDEEAVYEDEAPVQAPVRVEKTPGRNDPCYCGSGKKYKFCHGR